MIITREEIENHNKQTNTLGDINSGENNNNTETVEKFVNSKGEILTRKVISKDTLGQIDNTEKDNKQEPPKLSNNKIKFSITKDNNIGASKLGNNDVIELKEENKKLIDGDILVKEEEKIKSNPFEKTKFNYSMLIQILIELMIIFICLPIGMMFGWEHVILLLLITVNTLAIQVRRLI